MMRKLFLLMFGAALLSGGCYYDNLSEIHPVTSINEDCDTTTITYAKDIAPLISQNCGSENSCHQAANSDSEISLVTYDDVNAVVMTGQLMEAVTHTGNAVPMPYGGGKLSDCKINKIKAWINQGVAQQ